MKKNCKELIKNSLEIKKYSKEKLKNYVLTGKMISLMKCLIAGQIKKKVSMSDYFPKSKSVKGNIKFDLDLSNYTPKADLQNATGVNTSNFVKKS